MTIYANLYLPRGDYDELIASWSEIGEIKYSAAYITHYFDKVKCVDVIPQLEKLTIIINR